MSTKIIKLRDNNDNVLLPVSDASAVQYNDSGSKISVQTAIDERIKHAAFLCTSTSAAKTYTKTATVDAGQPSFPTENGIPKIGTCVIVKYTVTNTYKTEGHTYTLNINNTGDFPMYYSNAELATSTSANTLVAGSANRYVHYVFNGSQWVFVSASYDTNTTYSVMTLSAFNTGTETIGRTLTAVRLREILATTTADWAEDDSTALSYILNKPSFTEASAITDTKLKYDTLSVNGSTTITDPNLASMGLSNPVEVAPDWANYLVLN